jgi:hypothetical protein
MRQIPYMQLMVSQGSFELNEKVTIQCLLVDTNKAFVESKDIANAGLICYVEDETGKKYSIASGATDEKGRHDFTWRTRHAGVYKFSAYFGGDTNYTECWSQEVVVEWKKYSATLTCTTSNPWPGQDTLTEITGQLTDQKGEKLSGVDLRVFTFHWASTNWIEIMKPPRRVLCTNNDGMYKMLVYVPKAMDADEALFAQEPYSDDRIWDPAAYTIKYEGDDAHIKCENGIVISPEV